MILISLASLALAIGFYSVSQLQQHGKLRWTNRALPFSFWGKNSDVRKYKDLSREKGEAFKFSTTWLVFLTDGYHHLQFWFFNFLAVAFTFALGFNWWLLIGLLVGIRIVHAGVYRLLSK